MTLEDEILFERYHIIGYRNPDAGVCDGQTSARRDDDDRSDDSEGLSGDTSGHRDA